MQICSEFKSAEVKRSRNISLGQNLEGNHLTLVCMHKNRLNDSIMA